MIKTRAQIDAKVEEIQSLIDSLPPCSGHRGVLSTDIKNFWTYKGGTRPEDKAIEQWIYGNSKIYDAELKIHYDYLKFVRYLIANGITIDIPTYDIGNATFYALEQLSIDLLNGYMFGQRAYNDLIAQTIQPGLFRILPAEQWPRLPLSWVICRHCHRLTYHIPCDFCGEGYHHALVS